MPVLPPITASPFPTAMSVMNYARQRINDLLSTPAGAPAPAGDPQLNFTQVGGSNLLDVSTIPNSNVTQVIFQTALKKFLLHLEGQGYRVMIGDNLIIRALPANSSPDPAQQSYISWTEFFDGQYTWPGPVLPPDFAAPLKIQERITGTNSPFTPMVCGIDGIAISGWVRGIFNRRWEWRENKLCLVGAIGQTDLQLRFIKGIPAVQAIGNVPWYYFPIEVPDCENALSYYIAAEVGSARGPEFVADMIALAEGAGDELFNRQARADQRVNVRRQPRARMRRNYSYGL